MSDKRTIPRWQERQPKVSDRKIINALKSGKDLSKIDGIQIACIHGVEYFDLSGISIEGEILDISHLSKVDFSHSRFRDVKFIFTSVISGLLFYSSDFKDVSFNSIGSDKFEMKDIVIKDARIERTNFSNIDFTGRNYFLNSRFDNVDFSISYFGNSIFCDFSKSTFYRCSFRGVNADKSIMCGCLFSNSDLSNASMQFTNLASIDFKDCNLNLNTLFDKKIFLERNKSFEKAYGVYFQLKHLFRSKGHRDESQKYYLREMASKGKNEKKKLKKIILLAWSWICRYGQTPSHILRWILFFIFSFAFAHFRFGEITLSYGDKPDTINYFLKCLYFSVVTFTTLGYGDIVPTNSVSKFFASIETIVGPILISLFIVTIVKKIMQD